MDMCFLIYLQAIEKVIKIGSKYPMETHVDIDKPCMCTVGNETEYGNLTYPWYNSTEEDCIMASFLSTI